MPKRPNAGARPVYAELTFNVMSNTVSAQESQRIAERATSDGTNGQSKKSAPSMLSANLMASRQTVRAVNTDVRWEVATDAAPVTAVLRGVSLRSSLNVVTSQIRRNADVRATNAELMFNAEVNTVSARETLLNAGRTI